MYKYAHFISENTAPVRAKQISVYNDFGKKICNIPLGSLDSKLDGNEKLYSFCALADIHLTYDTANADFENALRYAEVNCDFTCIAGDLLSNGFIQDEFKEYKRLVAENSPTKPVYAIPGNHEHYSNGSYSYLENYTGYPLYYSFTRGNDVFIMVGHYGGYAGDGIGWLATETWSQEELQWLYEILEVNRNKRCFVFTHVLPHEHGVGNPNNLYVTAGKPLLWYVNDGGIGQAFISLLRHYKNTILFHGHSHTRFWLQELDTKANYSDADGYRSVHIPSLAVPRDPYGSNSLDEAELESEGYIVDVYPNCIILNGRDFVDNKKDGYWLPIGTYKIDTTLQTVEAGTFLDETGIIQT